MLSFSNPSIRVAFRVFIVLALSRGTAQGNRDTGHDVGMEKEESDK